MIKKFRTNLVSFASDKNFSEILFGSVWAIGSQVVAALLGLITSVMIARAYGPEMMGIVAIIQAILTFAMVAAVVGTNTSVLKLIPEHVTKYSIASASNVYKKVQYIVITLSILVGILIAYLSDWIAVRIFSKPHLSYFVTLAAVFVIFRSLMEVSTQAIRGAKLVKTYAVMRVLPPAIALTAIVAMTVLHAGPNSPIYAHLIAWCATALFGTGAMYRFFVRNKQSIAPIHGVSVREILSTSAPMLMTAFMYIVIAQIGVILLGVFSTEEDVGVYSIAVRLATLTSFFLHAINSMAAPKFSELFHGGATEELLLVAKKTTKLVFWTTLPILVILVVIGKPILNVLYGSDFVRAYPALVVLVFGQFVNSASGPTGHFLNMTGHQKVFRNAVTIAALINIVLGVVLVPQLGMLGAAIATMLCLACWNAYALIYIKRRYGKSIGYIPFLVRVETGSTDV